MSGSGSTGLTVDQFTDGTTILWGKLATTVVGGVLVVWSVGIGAIWDAIFSAAIAGVDWVAGLGSTIVKGLSGIVIAMGNAGWAAAIAPVEAVTGIWVPFTVLAIALGYLFILNRGGDE